MTCMYCEEEIGEGESYTYKWDPEAKIFKPVHSYHLDTKRTKNKVKE